MCLMSFFPLTNDVVGHLQTSVIWQTSWRERCLSKSFIWTWFHLLQFCVSNQRLSMGEDAVNKPWRPIPAGRLSRSQAKTFRWILLPACLALSLAYGIPLIGFALTIGILLNNEMRLDSHWFTRNVMNAIGYAVFDAGATTLARTGTGCLYISRGYWS